MQEGNEVWVVTPCLPAAQACPVALYMFALPACLILFTRNKMGNGCWLAGRMWMRRLSCLLHQIDVSVGRLGFDWPS